MYSCSSDHLCILLYICLSSTWKIESLQWSHKLLGAINSNYVFFNFHSKWWFSRMINDFFCQLHTNNFPDIWTSILYQTECSDGTRRIWKMFWGSFIEEKKTKTNLRCILSCIVLQQRFQFCISPHRHFCP